MEPFHEPCSPHILLGNRKRHPEILLAYRRGGEDSFQRHIRQHCRKSFGFPIARKEHTGDGNELFLSSSEEKETWNHLDQQKGELLYSVTNGNCLRMGPVALECNSETHNTAELNVLRARKCEVHNKRMKKQHKNTNLCVAQLNRIPVRLLQALARMEVRAEWPGNCQT